MRSRDLHRGEKQLNWKEFTLKNGAGRNILSQSLQFWWEVSNFAATYYLIKPTTENLALFWHSSQKQSFENKCK